MMFIAGLLLGAGLWFVVRCVIGGFYTVGPSERAVKTAFGRADRIEGASTLSDPVSESLKGEERERYDFPQVRVIPPGGPYFKWPWEKIHKVVVATETISMAFDPETPNANQSGQMLEAVTKDQLNTGLTGQIRFRISERNLYACLFGVKNPLTHVMGYFISILRERIANFSAPPAAAAAASEMKIGEAAIPNATIGVSINDLRKNLRDLNEHMDRECESSAARYGIVLEASLITGIDPPPEVESALAAINTAYNQVSSDISLAQASADQKLVQSRRAVEIETLKAQAEVEPLRALSQQLIDLKTQGGPGALAAYVRSVRLKLFGQARRAVVEVAHE